jgi:hypothetical protein
MPLALVVTGVSFLLGWRIGKWWVVPLVYAGLALALAFVFDPNAGPGEHDVARWEYAIFAPAIPALVAAVGTVITQAKCRV